MPPGVFLAVFLFRCLEYVIQFVIFPPSDTSVTGLMENEFSDSGEKRKTSSPPRPTSNRLTRLTIVVGVVWRISPEPFPDSLTGTEIPRKNNLGLGCFVEF